MARFGAVRVKVWDGPTRLFHWLLVLLLGFSWYSGSQGNDWLPWHFLSGYAILTLLLFRIAWGLVGSTYSRFTHFLKGPGAALHHLRGLVGRGPMTDYGHNPLGAYMIVIMLAVLLVQVGTGLFADDDIATEGPLGELVSSHTRSLLTTIHSVNFNIILILSGLHVAAVLYYLFVRRENLIVGMLRGYKTLPQPDPVPPRFVPVWRAAAILSLAALVVWAIVRLGGS
ncbi:MAG TPA: cytochrome b/b6 domain-containing protein [Stellaceae bacterium]|nr:cytochrome b/b6 domain-containing protein [Stellaceae bacterium]